MKKDKDLAAKVNTVNVSKSKDKIMFMDNSNDKISEPKHPKSYVRCKS
jgi:hypothetical protein